MRLWHKGRVKAAKKRSDRSVVYIRVSRPVRQRLAALVTQRTAQRGHPQTLNSIAVEMIVLGLDATDKQRDLARKEVS